MGIRTASGSYMCELSMHRQSFGTIRKDTANRTVPRGPFDPSHQGKLGSFRNAEGGKLSCDQRESPVSKLSTEVVAVASSEGVRKFPWTKRLFDEFTSKKKTSAVTVDNISGIHVAENPKHQRRMKHRRAHQPTKKKIFWCVHTLNT
ncbi:hypothetical protein DMENIID0001_030790 [Sergentomyia squamirostris]